MWNIHRNFQILSIVFALLSSIATAKPCSNVNQTVTGSPQERCDEATSSTDGGDHSKAEEDDSGLASHTVYTIVVIFGVVLIPIIVLTRICWLRKLQKQRCEVINDMRQIVDQRFSEEQVRSSGVFSLDITNIPVDDILGKPPSYEESIANPCIGCPPPYDQPPDFKQNQCNMNNNGRHASAGDINTIHYSNSDCVTSHEIIPSTSYNRYAVVNFEAPATNETSMLW